MEYSITPQIGQINEQSASQLISGIAIHLGEKSDLLSYARFSGLASAGAQSGSATDSKDGSREIQTLSLLLKSQADRTKILDATVDIVHL